MPITDRFAYFDHAAVAPLSGPAAAAIAQYTGQATMMGDTVWPEWASGLDRLRQGTTELIGCDPAEVFLVPNTTTGINVVADGWPWKPGDNVILPEGEFPSNLFPWQNQQSRGVEVRIVPRRGSEVHVEDLIERVDASTQIIAASWVGYGSGFRIDVDGLVRQAHQRGVAVFLDAIQGMGMYPLDISQTPVDFLAADGHKWMLGPEGAGVAMIRREHLDKIRCGNVGWGSVKNSHNYADPQMTLKDDATRFEPGSANMVGSAAMAASLEIFLQVRRVHGPEAIANRVIDLAEKLDHQLTELGIKTRVAKQRSHRSGIVTFEVPGVSPADFRERALAENVVTSCRDGGIRASIHAYNNDDDLGRLVGVAASLV